MDVNIELIKRMRKDLGLTQSEIAEKLFMHERQFQKIEKGQQKTNIWQFKSMMEMLGVSTSDFWLLYLDTQQYEGYRLYKKVQKFFDEDRIEESVELLELLEQHPIADIPVVKQSILHMRITVDFHFNLKDSNEFDYELVITRLKEALGRKINLCEIDNYVLTDTDIKILNHIAVIYSENKSYKIAVRILKDILKSKSKFRTSSENNDKLLIAIKTNLSSILLENGRHQEARNYAEEALAMAIENADAWMIPNLLIIKALCYKYLKNKENEINLLLTRAYHTANAIGRKLYAKRIAEIAVKEFNFIIL